MTPIVEVYHYGFAGAVGAHPSPRTLPEVPPPAEGGRIESGGGSVAPLEPNALVEFGDNRTYTLSIDRAHPIENAAIQGADGMRPYVRISSEDGGAANLAPVSGAPRSFRIEGLWLGSADDDFGDFIVERATPALDAQDWDEIVIRETTLDPGGVRADQTRITPLRLWIHGRVRRLVIERSIVGPIRVRQVPGDCSLSGAVEELEIRDSIVDATRSPGVPAIDCPTGRLVLRGVTVLGDIHALLLDASDTLVMGRLQVLNQDESCFRFSAASPGGSPVRRFESPTETAAGTPLVIQPAFFTSLRFGDPGYATLSLAAPLEIVRGAENGSEMGAFSFLHRPIQLGSVIEKVDEFKPAGLIAQYIFEAEHAGGALPPPESEP